MDDDGEESFVGRSVGCVSLLFGSNLHLSECQTRRNGQKRSRGDDS